MARTPTVYRWDDPGAPDLDAIMPTDADKQKLFIYTILKACLVDGYGSKSGAGWTMPLEEITSAGCRFVLKNASHSGCLLWEGGSFSRFNIGARGGWLWACIDVDDMDSPVGAWSHKAAYANRDTLSAANFHSSGIYAAHGCESWVVVANENFCVFIAGVSNDFDNTSSAVADLNYSCALFFGAMNDSFSDVTAPSSGNFYVAGGGISSSYSFSKNDGLPTGVLTSTVDILGIAKGSAHSSIYKRPNVQVTDSQLSAWLPAPVIYCQYGSSAPDGSSSENLYFSVAIPALRKLLLRAGDISGFNDFMVSNGFEYGKEFTLYGEQWVVFKSADDVVSVVSLAASEWGV